MPKPLLKQEETGFYMCENQDLVLLTCGAKASLSFPNNFEPKQQRTERAEPQHCAISAKATNLTQTNIQTRKQRVTIIAKGFHGRWMCGAGV